MAQAIRQVQSQGGMVAHAGKYHNQYHFFGRLQQPLIAMLVEELRAWLGQHPAAWVVLYEKRNQQALTRFKPLAMQPYRGKTVVLVDAKTALNLLPSLSEYSDQETRYYASTSRCITTSRDGEIVEMACLKTI